MKFLLDENMPKRVGIWLKKTGHQSITLKDLKKTGIKNGDVAREAIRMDAIILTCDEDFLSLKKVL